MNLQAHSGFAPDLVQWLLDRVSWHSNGLTVLGISGLQGSGKSTLAGQLVAAAQQAGKQAATLSLDDVYLTAAQRRQLAADIHPLLATRGAPGTHDLALLHRVLDALRAGRPTALPRFDKLGDDRLPEAVWPRIEQPLDLLVVEGWMLGARAQDDPALLTPLNALERDDDPDGQWRRWCNTRLADDYPALWQRLDQLVFLQPPGWEVVQRWRSEQETSLARQQGRRGMTAAALERFIAHYERVSRQLLVDLPTLCDIRIELDQQRRVRARHVGGADG